MTFEEIAALRPAGNNVASYEDSLVRIQTKLTELRSAEAELQASRRSVLLLAGADAVRQAERQLSDIGLSIEQLELLSTEIDERLPALRDVEAADLWHARVRELKAMADQLQHFALKDYPQLASSIGKGLELARKYYETTQSIAYQWQRESAEVRALVDFDVPTLNFEVGHPSQPADKKFLHTAVSLPAVRPNDDSLTLPEHGWVPDRIV